MMGVKHDRPASWSVKGVLAGAALGLCCGAASAQALSPFVESSLFHILFHETGHAVIDQFGLPVIGQEEDAADTFATLEISAVFDDAGAMLLDAAEAMIIMDEQVGDELSFSDFYSEHDLDIQRGLRIVCHAVGLQPELFDEAQRYFEMDAERSAVCEEDTALAADSWLTLIEPHLLGQGDPMADITLAPAPDDVSEEVRAALFDSGVMADFRTYLAETFAWPTPITVRVETCGEANAFYDPIEVSIIMCAEMVGFLREIEGMR